MRFDVALFLLRRFKSRTQATRAVLDGQVLLNGERVRPSHPLSPGDRVTLIGPGGESRFELLGLPTRSTSRKAARELVRDF
ncbi:MAG TPA: S4 domain-containing protein [Candidatus Eisenbacteria bacterium]|jgi:ribosome-associated heat shock protein Hsp15